MKFLTPTILTCSLALALATARADEFTDKFEKLRDAGDKEAVEKFLKQAAKTEADNPNYYATAGDYWWSQAGEAVVVPALPAGEFQLDPKDFSITDPKTGKKVGKMGPAKRSDSAHGQLALNTLTKGAKKFPHRADLAFGLAHLQKEAGQHDGYVETLIGLLAHAKEKPESLRWMEDEKLPQPAETYIPESAQPYSAALFKANSPATDKLCGKLLDAITDTYPDHPYAYNLKAALADANGKPKEAVKMLETAHEKAPKDALVLSNLAGAYAKIGDNEKAIEAYENVLKLKPNPRSKKKAEAELKKLRAAE